MRKLKTKLTKAKENPNSTYWKRKADKLWVEAIRDIWDGKCIICGETEGKLDCHHILPREIKEFRYNLANGILLCPLHHKFSNLISPHKNPINFYHVLIKRQRGLMEFVFQLLELMNDEQKFQNFKEELGGNGMSYENAYYSLLQFRDSAEYKKLKKRVVKNNE